MHTRTLACMMTFLVAANLTDTYHIDLLKEFGFVGANLDLGLLSCDFKGKTFPNLWEEWKFNSKRTKHKEMSIYVVWLGT